MATLLEFLCLVTQIYRYSILDFLLAKNRKREWLSGVQTRYRKTIEEWKYMESDFYTNDSPNDDLESWRVEMAD
jgi:hypothetical protein